MAMRSSVKVLAVAGLVFGNGALAQQPPPPVNTPAVKTPAPPLPKPVGKSSPAMPAVNPGTWVTNSDYPTASLRAGNEGVTGFRLVIDAQGLPTACEVTSSSGWQELDSATCSLMMQRARFIPGRDAKGRPTGATYSSRFRWVIPNGEGPEPMALQPITPSSRTMSFIVETDGLATNCQEVVNGTVRSGKTTINPCDSKSRFAPFLDPAGKPVRKKVTATMTLETSDP